MKYLLTTLLFSLMLMSCGSDGADSSASGSGDVNSSIPAVTPATSPLQVDPGATPPAQQQTVNIPAGPDGVLHHYICAKNDGGNGTAAGPCPVCGDALAHNSAFHANQSGGNTPPPVTINNGDGTTSMPSSVTTTPPALGAPGVMGGPPTATKAPEPPQNDKGVWHYTCSNGCAGGAGSASACAGCGSTLVHNPVYHQ